MSNQYTNQTQDYSKVYRKGNARPVTTQANGIVACDAGDAKRLARKLAKMGVK